jgi:hypothetical protein
MSGIRNDEPNFGRICRKPRDTAIIVFFESLAVAELSAAP